MATLKFSSTTALRAGFFAGLWDLFAALLIYSLIGSLPVITLLQFIASGALGKTAFTGGYGTVVAGLLFHFLIAMLFAFGYVFLYTTLGFLRTNKILSGLLYGAAAWIMMNYLVVPLSLAARGPIAWNAATWMNIGAHLGIGLILAMTTHKHYTRS